MKQIIQFLLTCTVCCLAPPVSFAVPILQLGIDGGFYDGSTETIITDQSEFTIRAILTPDSASRLNDTYFMSLAILPSPAETNPPPDLGSFVIKSFSVNPVPGATITNSDLLDPDGLNPAPLSANHFVDVTEDMVYGTPPLDVLLDNKDLPDHGVFDTYYAEISFKFDPTQQMTTINTENTPDTSNSPGTGSYYVSFTLDISNLDPHYQLHFDLYDTTLKHGNTVLGIKAPFSHDAGTFGTRVNDGPPVVPEPSAIYIFAGLAICFLGFASGFPFRKVLGHCQLFAIRGI